MRCLFITASMRYGGAERVMSILMNEWSKRGVESRVLITGSRGESLYPLETGISVVSYYREHKNRRFKHISIIRAIRKQCKDWEPDIIISFFNDLCALAAIAKFGMHIPLIYSERNDPNKTNQRLIDKLYRKITEKSTSFVVFQTKGAQNCYPKYVQRKSCIILNPVDIDRMPSPFVGERDKKIVNVGRLTSQKNQKMLIDAFASLSDKIPEYRLEIFGDGELRATLQKQIDSLQCRDRIRLMDTSSKVLDQVNNASIFVLTSDYEGIPNVLVEAMCMGVPCVSTDFSPGGASELINNGANGIIIPCGDVKALSEIMYELIKDAKTAETLGKNAVELCYRVNAENISTIWLNLLSRIHKENEDEYSQFVDG